MCWATIETDGFITDNLRATDVFEFYYLVLSRADCLALRGRVFFRGEAGCRSSPSMNDSSLSCEANKSKKKKKRKKKKRRGKKGKTRKKKEKKKVKKKE